MRITRLQVYQSLVIVIFACLQYVFFPTIILHCIVASRRLLEPFGLDDSLFAHKILAFSLVAVFLAALGWVVRRILAFGRRNEDAH